jgi:hypothetical protein
MFARPSDLTTVAEMVRRLLFLAIVLALTSIPAVAGEVGPGPTAVTTAATSHRAPNQVDVAPTKTSIYIGTVSMTMPTFVRHGGTFEASYTAKVFPYYFYNEKGTLTVNISDAQLDELVAGRTITFTGLGVRDDGTPRPVEGKAMPTDAKSGKLKVRVTVSKHVVLVFNTTYRFQDK